MGSSHSYLMNMQAAPGTTTMHNIAAGICYQYDVADLFTNAAMTKGSVAGTCANVGYATPQGSQYKHYGNYGTHHYEVEIQNYGQGLLQNLCDGSDCNQMSKYFQNLCDGSDCNQMSKYFQNLYQSQNLTHWVIDGKCYQKAVPANIMQQVLTAPINGLAGGCIVGGYTQANGTVSATVATFGDVVLEEYVQPSLIL